MTKCLSNFLVVHDSYNLFQILTNNWVSTPTVNVAHVNSTSHQDQFFFPFYSQTANDFLKNLVIVRKRRKRGAICIFSFFNCFQIQSEIPFYTGPDALKNGQKTEKQEFQLKFTTDFRKNSHRARSPCDTQLVIFSNPPKNILPPFLFLLQLRCNPRCNRPRSPLLFMERFKGEVLIIKRFYYTHPLEALIKLMVTAVECINSRFLTRQGTS